MRAKLKIFIQECRPLLSNFRSKKSEICESASQFQSKSQYTITFYDNRYTTFSKVSCCVLYLNQMNDIWTDISSQHVYSARASAGLIFAILSIPEASLKVPFSEKKIVLLQKETFKSNQKLGGFRTLYAFQRK